MAEPPVRGSSRVERPPAPARERPPELEDLPPPPETVRLAKAGRAPGALTAVIAVFLAIAVWKPWAGPTPPRALVQAAPTPHPAEPASSADPFAIVRDDCEDQAVWRVYSHEVFLGQDLRVWRSVTPKTSAADPLDAAIPVVPAGSGNRGLGYCTPWAGPDDPPAGSTVSAWQIVTRSGKPPEARAIRLTLLRPMPGDVHGALYAGPGDRPSRHDATTAWPAGRYVFAVRSGDWQRWWAVQVLPEPTPAR